MANVQVRTRETSPTRRDVNMWERFWEPFSLEWPWPTPLAISPMVGDWAPVIDLEETDNEIRVSSEIPGVEAKDIDVNISEDMLTIKGEKKQESEEKRKNYYRTERCYGSFQRILRMPATVDVNKCRAEYRNGVLKISCPKSEASKSKQVRVEVKE